MGSIERRLLPLLRSGRLRVTATMLSIPSGDRGILSLAADGMVTLTNALVHRLGPELVAVWMPDESLRWMLVSTSAEIGRAHV